MKCGVPVEGRRVLLNLGLTVLKVKEEYKDCWIFLL